MQQFDKVVSWKGRPAEQNIWNQLEPRKKE